MLNAVFKDSLRCIVYLVPNDRVICELEDVQKEAVVAYFKIDVEPLVSVGAAACDRRNTKQSVAGLDCGDPRVLAQTPVLCNGEVFNTAGGSPVPAASNFRLHSVFR
jgi:hypothetical protein